MRITLAAIARMLVVAPLTGAIGQSPGDLARAVDGAVAWERNAAVASSEIEVGEYRATAIVSPAESWYEWQPGGLVLHAPAPGTVHLKIILRDLKDGRVVPGLGVRGSFIAGDRTDFVERPMPSGWYPAVNGYGENFPAAEAGSYHIRIEIKPAEFPRHDREVGRRYSELLHAAFPPIQFDPAMLRAHEPLSDDAEGLRFARAQGAALDRALKEAWTDAAAASEIEAGEYRVACIGHRAEGYWYVDQGKFAYRTEAQMGDQDTAVRAIVRDSRTHRFLPELNVRVTVRDGAGTALGTAPEPFMWSPLLNHYGQNWRIPRTGVYAVAVRIDAPKWRRYGRQAGRRFASNGSVEFSRVRLESSPAAGAH